MSETNYSAKRLDHLGIIAGMCKHLEIVELIDELLPSPERKISYGKAIVAMILNAMGFSSRTMYLFPEFLETKPVELLLGEGVVAEDFNDDSLGRALDKVFAVGCTEFFAKISWALLKKSNISINFAHVDTTTFSLYGSYHEDESIQAPGSEEEPAVIKITHGFSKDKNPDLKQATLGLICANRSAIPIWLQALDGNSSDSKTLPNMIKEFISQLRTSDSPVFVMDSAFYSAENIQKNQNILWLTRVPERLGMIWELYEQLHSKDDWKEYNENYRYIEFRKTFAEIEQRWLLVHSKEREKLQQKTLEKNVQETLKDAQKALRELERKPFLCQDDAQKAANEFKNKYELYDFSYELEIQNKFTSRGRPRKSQESVISWKVKGYFTLNEAVLAKKKRYLGYFVLGTNQLNEEKISGAAMLEIYKSQGYSVERGFRFLKEPMFFAHSLFLKKPSRIMALLTIMTLSLLVYSLTERYVRRALRESKETIPDQKGKPTDNPTLRRVFQIFEGIDLLQVMGEETTQTIVVNLKDIHLRLLEIFPFSVKILYVAR